MKSTNVWFGNDILMLLQSASLTASSALQAGGNGDAYTRGYRDGHRVALEAIALAVGETLPESLPATWRVVDADQFTISSNGL